MCEWTEQEDCINDIWAIKKYDFFTILATCCIGVIRAVVAQAVEFTGKEYSSGFVMAITEFKISGVSGVAVHVATVRPPVVVIAADDEAIIAGAVEHPSTPSIGIPLILPFKFNIVKSFFFLRYNFPKKFHV